MSYVKKSRIEWLCAIARQRACGGDGERGERVGQIDSTGNAPVHKLAMIREVLACAVHLLLPHLPEEAEYDRGRERGEEAHNMIPSWS